MRGFELEAGFRRVRGPIAAVVLVALLATGCGEDPVPELEARRAELIETTLPRGEFWSEVERKGELTKELASLREERSAIDARPAALVAEREQIAAALEQAQEMNARAEELLARNRREAERLAGEVDEREGLLAGFGSRTRAPVAGAP